MSIAAYSTDPALNRSVGAHSIAEGGSAGDVDDALRQLLADLAVFRDTTGAQLTAASDALALGTVSALVGTRVYATQALLYADLVPTDGQFALVYADPTPSKNDLYRKTGATGAGSWSAPLQIFAASSAAASATAASVSAAAAAVAESYALSAEANAAASASSAGLSAVTAQSSATSAASTLSALISALASSGVSPSTITLPAASRVILAAITGQSSGTSAILSESGREGTFVFDGSDLSIRVAADPTQAVYVAPASAPTGASGAWVRVRDSVYWPTPRRLTYGKKTRVTTLRQARITAASIHTLVVGYAKDAGITGGNGQPEFIVAIDGMDPTIGAYSEGVGVGTYAWCLAQAQIAGGRIVFDPRGEFDLTIRDSVQNRFNVGAQNISVVAPGRNVTFWHTSLTGSTVIKSHNTIFAYIDFKTMPGPLSGDYDGSGNKVEVGLVSVAPQNIDKLAFIGCTFDSASDGALDIASTGFTTASSAAYVTIQDCVFRNTDEVSLFGSISDTTLTADARKLFVTMYRPIYDGCGQRQPKVLGLAMVDVVDAYTQMHPWRRDQPAPTTEFGACHGGSVQNGGWLLVRGCLWTALDGVAGYEATKLVANPISGIDGSIRVVDCAAENGMTFASSGVVADPAYIATLPHTVVPAAGTAREALIEARWLAAGAMVDAAPAGLFTYDPTSTEYPDQRTVVKRRVNGAFLVGNELRVDPQTEIPLDPGPGDGETFDATARGYTRTVGFTEGKTSLAAIGATMLDFANFDSSYHGVVGNGGPATVKHILFSDGSEPADGLRWWPQGTSSTPVTIVNATSAVVTATAATDTIAHAAHGEPTTGFPVVFSNSGGALPTPLVANVRYYAIRLDANSYKLAATYADAVAGTAIDLTGAGTGTHTATIGSFNTPNGADIVLNSSAKVAGFIFSTANLRFSVISRPAFQKADITDLQTIATGTYTPTVTAVVNVTAASPVIDATYTRIANEVFVRAIISITPTAVTTDTQVGISLPIASNFTASGDCNGTGACSTSSTTSKGAGPVIGDGANDRATYRFVSFNTGAGDYHLLFSYTVK